MQRKIIFSIITLLLAVTGFWTTWHFSYNQTYVSELQQPTAEKSMYLPKLLQNVYEEVEGDLWEELNADDLIKILIVEDENTRKYADYVEELAREQNYSVVRVEYSKMDNGIRKALERTLAIYGLPEELPIIAVVKPPVLYIACGTHTPPPDKALIEYLKKYHPLNFFSSNETRVAIVMRGGDMSRATELVEKLNQTGIETALYYKCDSIGFASAKVLDIVLSRSDSYVVIVENGFIKEVLPMDTAFGVLQNNFQSLRSEKTRF